MPSFLYSDLEIDQKKALTKSPELTRILFGLAARYLDMDSSRSHNISSLTPRENQVLALLKNGYTDKQRTPYITENGSQPYDKHLSQAEH
jgi:2-oxo-4-hydroxy-4-carboxy--5-ureidoimidazoline (OHCU) decarboxylase